MDDFTLNWRFLLFFTAVIFLFVYRKHDPRTDKGWPRMAYTVGFWVTKLVLLAMVVTAATGNLEWWGVITGD